MGAEDSLINEQVKWSNFSSDMKQKIERDRVNGISYLISGSLALAGGITGASVADDDIEKGIYTVFQTIGIASAGYGLYLWTVGDRERELYSLLLKTRGLSQIEKTMLLRSYYRLQQRRKKKERFIKALSHGLIAALNIYNATQQDEESIRDALYFVGGVNLLASISFTF